MSEESPEESSADKNPTLSPDGQMRRTLLKGIAAVPALASLSVGGTSAAARTLLGAAVDPSTVKLLNLCRVATDTPRIVFRKWLKLDDDISSTADSPVEKVVEQVKREVEVFVADMKERQQALLTIQQSDMKPVEDLVANVRKFSDQRFRMRLSIAAQVIKVILDDSIADDEKKMRDIRRLTSYEYLDAKELSKAREAIGLNIDQPAHEAVKALKNLVTSYASVQEQSTNQSSAFKTILQAVAGHLKNGLDTAWYNEQYKIPDGYNMDAFPDLSPLIENDPFGREAREALGRLAGARVSDRSGLSDSLVEQFAFEHIERGLDVAEKHNTLCVKETWAGDAAPIYLHIKQPPAYFPKMILDNLSAVLPYYAEGNHSLIADKAVKRAVTQMLYDMLKREVPALMSGNFSTFWQRHGDQWLQDFDANYSMLQKSAKEREHAEETCEAKQQHLEREQHRAETEKGADQATAGSHQSEQQETEERRFVETKKSEQPKEMKGPVKEPLEDAGKENASRSTPQESGADIMKTIGEGYGLAAAAKWEDRIAPLPKPREL